MDYGSHRENLEMLDDWVTAHSDYGSYVEWYEEGDADWAVLKKEMDADPLIDFAGTEGFLRGAADASNMTVVEFIDLVLS